MVLIIAPTVSIPFYWTSLDNDCKVIWSKFCFFYSLKGWANQIITDVSMIVIIKAALFWGLPLFVMIEYEYLGGQNGGG